MEHLNDSERIRLKGMYNKNTARSDYDENQKYKYFPEHIFKVKINLEKSR
jgi:hypothetical protein